MVEKEGNGECVRKKSALTDYQSRTPPNSIFNRVIPQQRPDNNLQMRCTILKFWDLSTAVIDEIDCKCELEANDDTLSGPIAKRFETCRNERFMGFGSNGGGRKWSRGECGIPSY